MEDYIRTLPADKAELVVTLLRDLNREPTQSIIIDYPGISADDITIWDSIFIFMDAKNLAIHYHCNQFIVKWDTLTLPISFIQCRKKRKF